MEGRERRDAELTLRGVCTVHISRMDSLERRFSPLQSPSARSKRIHFAMSDTLEMIPPAAAMASQLYHSMGITPPVVFLWGVATFSMEDRAVMDVTDRLMPRGSRIRVSTNSSHGTPAPAATTSPAVMNMRFE